MNSLVNLVPIRDTPNWMNCSASFLVLMPPEALILTLGPMFFLINLISSNVAPPLEKPVDVLT